MFIWIVERVSEQPCVCSMQRAKCWLQVGISDTKQDVLLPFTGAYGLAFHVYNDNEFDSSACKPTVHCQSLVYCLQQPKVVIGSLVG